MNGAAGHVTRLGEMHNAPYHQMSHGGPVTYQAAGLQRPMTGGSPVHSAMAAANVLHHLCEQSDWQWVDGMLLGGCLYYGLEKYEEALEWFARVLVVDKG
jgi:hypothetical protein